MIGTPLLLLAALSLAPGDVPAPPARPVSTITFHGWSPDSTQVGWGLERRGGGRAAKTVWYLKETRRTSHGKARLQKVKLPEDAKLPAYYRSNAFELHDLPAAASGSRTRTEIPLRYDRTLVLELKVEDKIRLYYWFEEGENRLLLDKVTFEEIYFAFDARAWLSPDGRRVALALGLDGDIRLDAAFVVLVLPVAGWQDEVRRNGTEPPRP
ncbi:MAG: hypothetical protein ABIK09_05065 [Pseudomonadota bacterium]